MIIIAAAAVIACFSAYMAASILTKAVREQKAFDSLNAIVEQEKEKQKLVSSAEPVQIFISSESEPVQTFTSSGSDESVRSADAPSVLPEYAELYEQNSDLFGWLSIDGSAINYPVMYTPDEPQYYFRRAFDKSAAYGGTPFLDAACFEGCGNYVIYGHHLKNGGMFGQLMKYADKEYWEQHKTFCFDTVYEHGEYDVIAAFYGRAIAKGSPGFRYYQYTDLGDPDVFSEFMEQVRAAAIYDTGITAEYGDGLITLSTCSYHTDNGRFAVVAKKREAF